MWNFGIGVLQQLVHHKSVIFSSSQNHSTLMCRIEATNHTKPCACLSRLCAHHAKPCACLSRHCAHHAKPCVCLSRHCAHHTKPCAIVHVSVDIVLITLNHVQCACLSKHCAHHAKPCACLSRLCAHHA